MLLFLLSSSQVVLDCLRASENRRGPEKSVCSKKTRQDLCGEARAIFIWYWLKTPGLSSPGMKANR